MLDVSIPLWATEDDVAAFWHRQRMARTETAGIRRASKLPAKRMLAAQWVYPYLDQNGTPMGGWEALWSDWDDLCDYLGRTDWQCTSKDRFSSEFRRRQRAVWGAGRDTTRSPQRRRRR